MVSLISTGSNYIIVIMGVIYAITCFTVFLPSTEKRQVKRMDRQELFMFVFHFICYGVLFAKTLDTKIIFLYLAQVVFFKMLIFVYSRVYVDCSRILMNHTCFLLLIGFVMLTRLSFDKAVKQFIIAAATSLIVLFIPYFMEKAVWLKKLKWIYGLLGLIFLSSVFVIGTSQNGATNWISLGHGIALQPSEFVKISFVFFIAAMLTKAPNFKTMLLTSIFAACHVIILIGEKDLGGALIYFVVYVFLCYVATGRGIYLFGGIGAGTLAAKLAYMLFAHVRVRFIAWKDPWSVIEGSGYQITQSLFAIAAGSWLGKGLTQGRPNDIPIVESDFIFSAITEEFGILFAICLILIYLGVFIHFLKIAMDVRGRFYKLLAYGFSICFIFQVFLTIGGVTKFIPSTGVTLPLISYGGSSVASTLIIFAVMQGIFIIAYKEDDENEEEQAGQPDESDRKNTTERRESRRHDQKETLFFDIKSLFTPRRGKKLKTNRYMLQTSIIVVALFLGLIGYVVKFTLKDSSSVAQSSYNKRNSSLSDQTKRGQILSANQKILAYSENNEAGDEIRHYPYENMFAHIIGYTSYGKAGLESVCNSDLLTSHEKLMKQLSNGVASKKNIGNNVITTLDTRLQKAAYEALEDYRGAVVAIEPKTGKVRALVSKPDFDPNKLDDIWDKITSDSSESCLLNRATQGLYPPGSTYKVLTALEYMEEHPNSYKNFSYECDGQTIVNSVRISCYENEEHGEVDLDRAFAKSCNTAFVTLGSKLDIKNFVSLNKKCLFNQEIPFDLAVKKSRFELTQNSDKSEIPQTVIGQGNTLMTPFHNALLMCAVANEGTLMKPYVVDHVEGADGTTVKETIPEIYADLMSEKDAKKLQKMLREVVTSGTGYNLDTDLYTAAGKTGTAENEGKYAHAWFVGYSNVEDSDLVVCVLVENVGAGSKYAVPIAKRVFDSYYNNNMKEYYSQKTDIESTQTNQ